MTDAMRAPVHSLDPREQEPRRGGSFVEISPLSIAIVVLRGRRFIFGFALLFVIPVGLLGLVSRRTYTAQSSFIAQGRRPQAAISGIAAQFGINMSSTDPGQSPDFYVDLLRTRSLLRGAVETRYTVPTPGGARSGTLVDFFESKGPTAATRRDAAIEQAREWVNPAYDSKTNIVRLSVTSPYPALSQAINNRLVALLSDYNLRGRQSQARSEREFAERRLVEVRGALRLAEERLQAFRQQNRIYSDVSELALMQQRLDREVQRQQQLYTLLLQMFEQARLDEVRDTPVFTVIENPDVPLKPDPRGVVKRTGLALLAGLVVGVIVAFGSEAARRYSDETTFQAAELKLLWAETTTDLRRLVTFGLSRSTGHRQRA